MKSALKLFYIVIVAIVVFMGALLIAEGVRERGAQPQAAPSAEAQAQTPSPYDMLDKEEGSAL